MLELGIDVHVKLLYIAEETGTLCTLIHTHTINKTRRIQNLLLYNLQKGFGYIIDFCRMNGIWDIKKDFPQKIFSGLNVKINDWLFLTSAETEKVFPKLRMI